MKLQWINHRIIKRRCKAFDNSFGNDIESSHFSSETKDVSISNKIHQNRMQDYIER